MSTTERVAYGSTGALFTAATLHVVGTGFSRAWDAGMIGDPHLPLNGYGIAMGLFVGAAMGVVTGVEMIRASLFPPRQDGAPL